MWYSSDDPSSVCVCVSLRTYVYQMYVSLFCVCELEGWCVRSCSRTRRWLDITHYSVSGRHINAHKTFFLSNLRGRPLLSRPDETLVRFLLLRLLLLLNISSVEAFLMCMCVLCVSFSWQTFWQKGVRGGGPTTGPAFASSFYAGPGVTTRRPQRRSDPHGAAKCTMTM